MDTIQAAALNEALRSGRELLLLDVRTSIEHREKHIEGSQLMPLDALDAAAVKAALGQARQCVIICHSGRRAAQAQQKLAAAGCERLAVLEGGVSAWEAAGLPLTHSAKKHLPLMRQVQLIIGLCVLAGSILAYAVNPNFIVIPVFFACGLTFAGATGWCGLAIFLSRMPWNKVQGGSASAQTCTL
jgi:rhodanese-related sulfurtransferase